MQQTQTLLSSSSSSGRTATAARQVGGRARGHVPAPLFTRSALWHVAQSSACTPSVPSRLPRLLETPACTPVAKQSGWADRGWQGEVAGSRGTGSGAWCLRHGGKAKVQTCRQRCNPSHFRPVVTEGLPALACLEPCSLGAPGHASHSRKQVHEGGLGGCSSGGRRRRTCYAQREPQQRPARPVHTYASTCHASNCSACTAARLCATRGMRRAAARLAWDAFVVGRPAAWAGRRLQAQRARRAGQAVPEGVLPCSAGCMGGGGAA